MFDWDHGPHWFQINQSATRIFCNDPWSPHAMDVPRCAEVCGQQWRSSRRNCCKTVGLCNTLYISKKAKIHPLASPQISPKTLELSNLEHAHRNIVDFPMKNGDFPWFSIVFSMFPRSRSPSSHPPRRPLRRPQGPLRRAAPGRQPGRCCAAGAAN